MVDEYVVSYRRLNGREGQCSSFQDEGRVTVRPERQVVSYVAILHLKAYSSYVVNVTGKKGALYNTSDSLQFETNSTGIYNVVHTYCISASLRLIMYKSD